MSNTKAPLRKNWASIFKEALEADTWGQSLEAQDEYNALLRSIKNALDDSSINFSADERSTLAKFQAAIGMRLAKIDGEEQGLNLDDMKKLTPVLDDLFRRDIHFPLDVKAGGFAQESNVVGDFEESDNQESHEEKESTMNPQTTHPRGTTTLRVTIDKIGLKDAQTYIEAHMTVSVVDPTGSRVLEQIDTGNSNRMKPYYVTFQESVNVSTPLETFQQGHTLFFEFKHYKPKKRKVSTRCFTFMEFEEIEKYANGQTTACLELYKKPTDFTRKRINLFTIKKLYLHVQVSIQRH